MADTAVAQTPRLIELIAWLSQSDSAQPISYRKAAKHFGVSPETIRADLKALVDLSNEHKDWLASLRVAFLADDFVVQSLGAFRRPTQFTAEEGLAFQLGLGAVRGGKEVATKFARQMKRVAPGDSVEAGFAIGAAPSAELDAVLATARRARDESRKLAIEYCGSDGEPSSRIVHVHQIVESAGRWYVIAWCEAVQEIRRFRADRILEAKLLAQEFRRQVLFQPVKSPDELLSDDGTVQATVAFSKKIARWLVEKYPGGTSRADGSYVVTFRVVDPVWLVREVLQYGAEAEVLGPEGLREAVRRMVS